MDDYEIGSWEHLLDSTIHRINQIEKQVADLSEVQDQMFHTIKAVSEASKRLHAMNNQDGLDPDRTIH